MTPAALAKSGGSKRKPRGITQPAQAKRGRLGKRLARARGSAPEIFKRSIYPVSLIGLECGYCPTCISGWTAFMSKDSESKIDTLFDVLMKFLILTLWLAVLTLIWIVTSAVYNAVYFFISIWNGPAISPARWVVAISIFALGAAFQAYCLRALITGQSEEHRWKRTAAIAIPAMFSFIMLFVPLTRGALELFGYAFNLNTNALYLMSEGPHSFGQAMGMAIGFYIGPLLFATGLAKGVLLGGHPIPQIGCELIQRAVAAGLIDVSTLWALTKSVRHILEW